MKEYLTLGSAPCNEPCAQVGQENYGLLANEECQRYKKQLRKTFGQEPGNARLAVKAFPHDWGSYYEVVIYFNPDNEEETEYAFRMERELPETWET